MSRSRDGGRRLRHVRATPIDASRAIALGPATCTPSDTRSTCRVCGSASGGGSAEVVGRRRGRPEVVDVLDADREPDQASGMVAGSVFHRRRRSKVDSTPPRLVACTHSSVVCGEQVGGQRALGEHDRDDRAEAGVADLADRRVLREPADQLLRRWPARARPARAACAARAARARPRRCPGIAPIRSRRSFSTS